MYPVNSALLSSQSLVIKTKADVTIILWTSSFKKNLFGYTSQIVKKLKQGASSTIPWVDQSEIFVQLKSSCVFNVL